MTRVEVFVAINSDIPEGRRFVALLQGLTTSPKGKVSIAVNMAFYGSDGDQVRGIAEEWLASEQQRVAGKERAAEETGERQRNKAREHVA